MNKMAILALSAFLLAARPAVSCDCAPPPPPKKALEQAAAVFLAKVLDIEEDANGKTVTLEVELWWKGGEAVKVKVSTATNSAACGYHFRKGDRYLVYAGPAGGQNKLLHVSLCSRTRTAEVAKKSEDFKDLGEGKQPAKKE